MTKPTLNEADYAYYVLGKPILSDHEYDKLKAEGELIGDDVIGDDRTEHFPKYQHGTKLLSLNNTYDPSELQAFLNNITKQIPDATFAVEQKIDGLALTAIYEDGKLKTLATRGNGQEGDNVINNAHLFVDLPQTIPVKGFREIRGEGVMTFKEFERINMELEDAGLELYSNPRNLASGTLKSQDIAPGARQLQFMAYRVLGSDNDLHQEDISWLRQIGFNTASDTTTFTADEVIPAIHAIDRLRESLPYPTDGAVVKVSSKTHQELLGDSTKAPKWSVAYKYAPEEAQATVISIEWEVGRDGRLTPCANLTPVNLAGTVVRRATLHNFDKVAQLDVRVGSVVVVCKAGEIIPYIIRTVSQPAGSSPTAKPTVCPACGSPVKHRTNSDGRVTVHLFCENENCSAKLLSRLLNFTCKKSLDIDGFGDSAAQGILGLGLTNVFDIFHLTVDDFLRIPGFGQGKATNLYNAIQSARTSPTHRIITSLGIPYIGSSVGKRIILDLSKLTNSDGTLNTQYFLSTLKDVKGIYTAATTAITEWLTHDANKQLLLSAAATFTPNDKVTGGIVSTKLAGKTFVITGTLPSMTREEAQALIISHSGTVSGSITKKTSYLLMGEKSGSKYDKAVALNIAILSQDDLTNLITN